MNRPRLSTFLFSAVALLAPLTARSQTTVTWQGAGGGSQTDGNWSNPNLWNPTVSPNNGGSNAYNVSIPGTVSGNGPTLDISVTINNLTVSTVSQILSRPGFDLNVTGTTRLETGNSFGGVLNANGNNLILGTLANYDAGTQTLQGGNMTVGGATPSTIQFRNANIVNNNGALVMFGDSQFRNQNNGANALANLALNGGLVQFAEGANFTTAGNFTNTGLLGVTNFTSGGDATTFTVGGALTNFDASTGTLTGGSYVVSTPDAPATIRFAGADIRTLRDATVQRFGANARITDLAGNDAFRNLERLDRATFNTVGLVSYSPASGVFTNDGGTHTVVDGANVTINGNYQQNGGATAVGNSTVAVNTQMLITGSAQINGGRFDFGGQPGVNTIYTTSLQVINGIEFRGAFLTGSGTIIADTLITNGTVVAPGHSPGALNVEGALTLDPGVFLQIQIGGLTPGDGYDLLAQTGSATLTLGGELQVSFIDGFEQTITGLDTFGIVTSENALAGQFDNVASGDRIMTADGAGSFLVTYAGQNNVVLSDFQAVPEPGTLAAAGLGVAGLLLFARRRNTGATIGAPLRR